MQLFPVSAAPESIKFIIFPLTHDLNFHQISLRIVTVRDSLLTNKQTENTTSSGGKTTGNDKIDGRINIENSGKEIINGLVRSWFRKSRFLIQQLVSTV